MSAALAIALLNSLDENALRDLAEKLRPYLRPESETGSEWLRGAEQIAAYIGAPVSRVYALSSANRCPALQHDGAILCARKSDLDQWLRSGGGRRPER